MNEPAPPPEPVLDSLTLIEATAPFFAEAGRLDPSRTPSGSLGLCWSEEL